MGKNSTVFDDAPGRLDRRDSLALYWRPMAARGIDFGNSSAKPNFGSIMAAMRN